MSRKYSSDKNQEIYFKIYLAGKELAAHENTLVEEIVYEDTSTGSDLCSITIHDPDYLIIGDKRIVKSTACKVIGGYKRDYKTWIDGFISAVDVDFPAEGYPTITLHIMDRTYLMNKLERKKGYKNMTYTAIAQAVAKMYGLSFDGDSSGGGGKKQESITQSYETDIQFLQGIANEIGYLVWVDSNRKLHWKDKESFMKSNASTTLWYKKAPFDIISFRPRIIQADQMDEVEESDIDSKDKKPTTAKVTKTPAKDSSKTSGSKGSGNKNTSGKKPGASSGGEMVYNPHTGTWTRK